MAKESATNAALTLTATILSWRQVRTTGVFWHQKPWRPRGLRWRFRLHFTWHSGDAPNIFSDVCVRQSGVRRRDILMNDDECGQDSITNLFPVQASNSTENISGQASDNFTYKSCTCTTIKTSIKINLNYVACN